MILSYSFTSRLPLIRQILEHWKENSGYHRRSLAETAVYQIKTAFGPEIRANEIQNQIAEAVMKSKVLNKFIHQGMPDSVTVND